MVIEEEVIKALELAAAGQDFLLNGGAGSGKTYSMLSFLDETYDNFPRASVACITFTNVAVNEIKSRFPTTGLHVSTIHDFMWNLVRPYQKNMRISLAELVNTGEIRSSLGPINSAFWTEPIRYKEWLDLGSGEISHAEVLKVAKHLFSEYPKLARILSDRYDFLLIDEYQDTPTDVLKILLEELPSPENRGMRLGFFGDSQQSIHEEGKGDEIIEWALQSGRLSTITKKENRRNPAAVISVINRLRADGLRQVQSDDPKAPNFQKKGSAYFLYTTQQQLTSGRIRDLSFCRDWNFASDETKLLYLSKAMIAQEMQFPRLMGIYAKDRVVEYAKKIKDFLEAQDQSIPDGMTFGDAFETYEAVVKPTRTQRRAFDSDPSLLTFASRFLLEDISNTSRNSDRLIGTKKVSDFDERDRGEKRDDLINHLVAIQELRSLYRQRGFGQIIRKLDFPITSIKERKEVASNIETLHGMVDSPISTVIEFADTSNLLTKKDSILKYAERNPYRYARVGEVPFSEIASLYEYVEDYSPYSTQHGVKGSEWNNVFISLDNGGWNDFNFEKLMTDSNTSPRVEIRSRMMLYVTCSRAKENLIVYAHEPSPGMLERAREWFGDEGVVLAE